MSACKLGTEKYNNIFEIFAAGLIFSTFVTTCILVNINSRDKRADKFNMKD
jgi:hypothetical protein